MAVPGRISAAPGGPAELVAEEFFHATIQPSSRGRYQDHLKILRLHRSEIYKLAMSRTSTTSGASKKLCAALASPRINYTPEEKVAILRRHLVEGVPISDLCDELGLQPAVFYR
jgi:transposase